MGLQNHCLGSYHPCQVLEIHFMPSEINPYEFQGILKYPKILEQIISLSDLRQIAQIFFLRDRNDNSDFSMSPEYFISARDRFDFN
jgi:hypothetical protein